MIKVENIGTWGFDHAIRAMRNPHDSWNKSDSFHGCNGSKIGKNGLDLMNRLFNAGVEHRTYARLIQVSMDITAPLLWWKEMDRCTVGKSQISCSTMHTIANKEFEMSDFSFEGIVQKEFAKEIVKALNIARGNYNQGDTEYWNDLIRLLPSSYNQRRTILMSYEVVFKIIKERTGHKLKEWNDFVEVLRKLPYVGGICGLME